jgi:nicotinate-nucleotide adenylyltransferase
MVSEAVRSDPRFEVSTVELDRGGPSYMIDTVRALRGVLPDAELFLILGADQVRDFPGWREPEQIVRHVQLAVMDREGESAGELAHGIPGGDRAVFVPVRRVDVSSTEIRDAIRSGAPLGDRVPRGVAAIIEREGLYSAS